MQHAASNHWKTHAHADENVDNSLCELNRRFIDLIAADELPLGATWASGSDIARCLANMPTTQRAAVADCPYALFDLRFADDAHWNLNLRHTDKWYVAEPAPAAPAASPAVNFARMALFYAWHVAHAAALSARVQLGMNEGVVAAFRNATLDRLPALAAAQCHHLSLKWHAYPAYWQLLTRAAARTNDGSLRRVQLYGLQLAAGSRLHVV